MKSNEDIFIRSLLSTTLNILFLFLFVALTAKYLAAMTSFAFTFDFGWILRSGEYLLEHKGLPSSDIFSWTFPEKSWILYQWLFNALIAALNKFLGFEMLVRLFIVFVIFIYFLIPYLMEKLNKTPPFYGFFISSVALLTVSINMSLRPMIITTFFLLVQYYLIQALKKNKISANNVFLIFIFMYILWANMHTGVAIGLFSLLLTALGDFLEEKKIFKFYILLFLVSFLATLVNPYGLNIYIYLVKLMSQSYLNNNIAELQSPDFHIAQYCYFAVLLIIFLVLLNRSKNVFSASDFLHLIVFTLAMLFVQRFMIWTCLYYVLILPKASHLFLESEKPWEGIRNICRGYDSFKEATLVCVSAVVILFLFLPILFPPVTTGKCGEMVQGIETYKKLKLPSDRLFTDPHLGSCSIFVNPNEKVFSDTRFDFYGQDFTKEVLDACFLTSENWESILNKWGINTIFIHKHIPLSYVLKERKDYRSIYEDKKLVIFRKS